MTEQLAESPQHPYDSGRPAGIAQAPVTPPRLSDAATGPTIQMPNDVLDLDAARKARAAAREGRRESMPIRLGGREIAVLPVELPLDVLAPLRGLDDEFTLILRQSMHAVRGADADARRDAGETVVDVLAANPGLPVQVLDTLRQVAVNLITEDGFQALMAQRPSPEDLSALVKGVLAFYGVTLGESLRPSASSSGSGATSSTTSAPTSASTPATSTPRTTQHGMSAFGAS